MPNRLHQRIEQLQIKGASFNEALVEAIWSELAAADEHRRMEAIELKTRIGQLEDRVASLERSTRKPK